MPTTVKTPATAPRFAKNLKPVFGNITLMVDFGLLDACLDIPPDNVCDNRMVGVLAGEDDDEDLILVEVVKSEFVVFGGSGLDRVGSVTVKVVFLTGVRGTSDMLYGMVREGISVGVKDSLVRVLFDWRYYGETTR
ncbi:hypothetical protein C0989_003017 [Termitomyces sp. Mn162]|nr:hypothetical protein C0989_003017 [Termitomyces sp. Mn162]